MYDFVHSLKSGGVSPNLRTVPNSAHIDFGLLLRLSNAISSTRISTTSAPSVMYAIGLRQLLKWYCLIPLALCCVGGNVQ